MTILDSAVVMPRTCAVADQVLLLDTVGSTNTYAEPSSTVHHINRNDWKAITAMT